MKALPIALGALALAGSALAQDVEAGRKTAGMCRTCHGLHGYAQVPVAPHIGGEPAEYLAGQLEAFRSGERTHEMMSVVAAGLSDRQIADVAAWYAAQTPVTTLRADRANAPALCARCHGADGLAVAEGTPNLAAENTIYIQTQLKAFRSGKRPSETMAPIAQNLSDADIRAVADWYGAVELDILPPE